MQNFPYIVDMYNFKRLATRKVKIGNIAIGGGTPIKWQTMLTTDTLDTEASVAQAIRCIDAGSELIRITAPSQKEAENLYHIKKRLRELGYETPLVADIHFTPNAAEIAARIVEKVRINPGNYLDKKKFNFIDYTDASYQEEIEKIHTRFKKLLDICKQYNTALRIGTNHGSLSDRIMSRYGDNPVGMVESAMEFMRIARTENFHELVLSMKASNTLVMVAAYRLVVKSMADEFGECYPLHLGITEAGDGEDGRIKSAVGMGSLLTDGIGDTVRVSLTEEPEFEIPVCRLLVKQLSSYHAINADRLPTIHSFYDPFVYQRQQTSKVENIGGGQVPIVISDLSNIGHIDLETIAQIGYTYHKELDKWTINDGAADYIYIAKQQLSTMLPTTLGVIVDFDNWKTYYSQHSESPYYPLYLLHEWMQAQEYHQKINFVKISLPSLDVYEQIKEQLKNIANKDKIVFCLDVPKENYVQKMRYVLHLFFKLNIKQPIVIFSSLSQPTTVTDEIIVCHATQLGSVLIDGLGDGICVTHSTNQTSSNATQVAFINAISFGILQATRTRISKTEYISCPSCGRTLFDLQSTTHKIRTATHHLKGLKIAVMGCIVNGPGEMADADYGYVGSGVGKISLYKGKQVVKRNIDSSVAVEELIELIKTNHDWINPQ